MVAATARDRSAYLLELDSLKKKPTSDAHSNEAEITAQLLGFTLAIKNIPRGTIVATTPPIIGVRTLGGERITVAESSTIKIAELASLIAITESSMFGEARNDIAQ